MKIKTAQGQIRSAKGSSFITKGGDDFDHKAMKKARRSLDAAIITESSEDMTPESVVNVDKKWVVEIFGCDGDKWWLDGYDIHLVTDSYKEANGLCVIEDTLERYTTDGRPAPKSILSYRDVTNDIEAQWWFENQARMKYYRDLHWDDYAI